MRMLERVGLALALGALAAVPSCYEIDQAFPWNWHVPKKIKPYERLPGKTDVEEKKEQELEKERRAQEAMRERPRGGQRSRSGDELDTASGR